MPIYKNRKDNAAEVAGAPAVSHCCDFAGTRGFKEYKVVIICGSARGFREKDPEDFAMKEKKKRIVFGGRRMRMLCLFCLLCAGVCFFAGSKERTALAAAEGQPAEGKTDEGQAADSTPEDAGETSGAEEGQNEYVVKPMTGADKFRLFLCCVFGVGICIVAALWGDPRERLKDKYKRARKQQALEEKRKRQREEKEARLAAEKNEKPRQ